MIQPSKLPFQLFVYLITVAGVGTSIFSTFPLRITPGSPLNFLIPRFSCLYPDQTQTEWVSPEKKLAIIMILKIPVDAHINKHHCSENLERFRAKLGIPLRLVGPYCFFLLILLCFEF